MNGDGTKPVVDAVLPGGAVVRVRVAEDADDAMGSVGLLEGLDLGEALEGVGQLASLVRASLEPLMPTKASVEFGVSFSVKAGKLTSLLVDGQGDASLTVALEWEALGGDRPAA